MLTKYAYLLYDVSLGLGIIKLFSISIPVPERFSMPILLNNFY